MLPALATGQPTLLAVHVYRSELVEERVIAVPMTDATGPSRAARILGHYIGRADRETFAVLMLDAENAVLGLYTVAVGSLSRVSITSRAVFQPAILRLAERLVLGHNHVLGDATPSREDKAVTKDLVRAGKLLDINVVDHLIVTRNGKFFSFAQQGLIGS
jgi:DNA repair protein RadC